MKMTDAKRRRAGYKIILDHDGKQIITDERGFRAPAAKVVRIVEYKGQKFPVVTDGPDQVINPKKAFYRYLEEAKKWDRNGRK